MKTPHRRGPQPMPPALPALLALALLAGSAGALAQDRADLERTQIIGNRELPKVIYIVPWKKPLPGQLSGRPVVSVLDEALAPVERDVHKRHVSYSTQLIAQQAQRVAADKPATTALPATASAQPTAQPAATARP